METVDGKDFRTFVSSLSEQTKQLQLTEGNGRVNRQESQGSPSEGNRLQMSDTFLISLLSSTRKQTSDIFPPSLYKSKKRFLLKYCVAIMTTGST